jgi:hypothetical protein
VCGSGFFTCQLGGAEFASTGFTRDFAKAELALLGGWFLGIFIAHCQLGKLVDWLNNQEEHNYCYKQKRY